MKEAEESNHFVYKASQASKVEAENEDDEEEDDEEYEKKTSDENTISNLAKQLLKSKLEKTEPLVLKTAAASKNVEQEKDDLDLELDMDLDNVDTTDVNLDDDLSD